MVETIERLFARAEAAIAESRRLLAISQALQDRLRHDLDRLSFRVEFRPSDRKIHYPQDFEKDRSMQHSRNSRTYVHGTRTGSEYRN